VILSQDDIWRQGLRKRGKDWVLAELHRRAGGPDDVLLEVVFQPPYPTRAFCLQWCAEEESRIRVPPSLRLALVVAVLTVVCVLKAVTSFQSLPAEQGVQASNAAPRAATAQPIGMAAGITPGPGSATQTNPASNTDLSTVCAYQAYATAACPARR